jgi:shikimate kinase
LAPDRRSAAVIVGFMGSGKTTVGRLLAERLGWEFLDTDEMVERSAGEPIARIFAASGEARFRRLEAGALAEALLVDRAVIAAGGGLFQSAPRRREIGARACSVWLDLPLEIVRRRLGQAADRPLWTTGDPLAQRVLFERRRAAYALARIRVPAWPGEPQQIVERVLDLLSSGFFVDSRTRL